MERVGISPFLDARQIQIDFPVALNHFPTLPNGVKRAGKRTRRVESPWSCNWATEAFIDILRATISTLGSVQSIPSSLNHFPTASKTVSYGHEHGQDG